MTTGADPILSPSFLQVKSHGYFYPKKPFLVVDVVGDELLGDCRGARTDCRGARTDGTMKAGRGPGPVGRNVLG